MKDDVSFIKRKAAKLFSDNTIDAVEYNAALECAGSLRRVEESLEHEFFERSFSEKEMHERLVLFHTMKKYLDSKNRLDEGFKAFLDFRIGWTGISDGDDEGRMDWK